ncbi:hypothetical protein V5O48_016943 [Marasmius crinis-equi]|uniref:Uncharacterized protein n=1 Tax=Marasmius crinis-equi TaxID=585013 RepID=A0ABR3EQK7_9AGAR
MSPPASLSSSTPLEPSNNLVSTSLPPSSVALEPLDPLVAPSVASDNNTPSGSVLPPPLLSEAPQRHCHLLLTECPHCRLCKSPGESATSSLKRKRGGGAPATRSKRRKADSDAQEASAAQPSERDDTKSDGEGGQAQGNEAKVGPVDVPEDAPAYIWKVIHMCDLLQVGEEMNGLLEAWVKLEVSAGYEGTGILTASSQPAQIAEWIQHGRRPNFKPKINGVEGYGDKFCAWFKKCSPAWREPKEGTIVMARKTDQDWGELKITGQNGVTSVIAAMAFWRYALDTVPANTPWEKQARERLEKRYREAFEEVAYSVSQMNGD